jgi:hypothetical protein
MMMHSIAVAGGAHILSLWCWDDLSPIGASARHEELKI